MLEIFAIFTACFFCFLMGGLFSQRQKKEDIEIKADDVDEYIEGETERDPLSLRNGFEVTRDENPTFMEQIVNVMNYNGKNQKEEDYGKE